LPANKPCFKMKTKNEKHIALLGATGKVGQNVLAELIRRNYKVRILVRNPEKLLIPFHPKLDIIRGNVRNKELLMMLMRDCSSIISTIGPRKEDMTICSDTTQQILDIMTETCIKRYIVLSGNSSNAPGDCKSRKERFRDQLLKLIFPSIIADKQNELNLLLNSNSEWTYIRSPFITTKPSNKSVKVCLTHSPGNRINCQSLALFISNQLENEHFIRKAPMVAN